MSVNQQSILQTEQNGRPDAEIKHKAMEGQGMGGHQFGEDGKATPMGDDKDNPSRNAGYSNPYFARTAPSDEDTANNNFKAEHQEGAPNYDGAQQEQQQQDPNAKPNIPGPQEVPDQQKVGEEPEEKEPEGAPDTAYQEPGLGDPQPDHGSDATETGEDPDEFQK